MMHLHGMQDTQHDTQPWAPICIMGARSLLEEGAGGWVQEGWNRQDGCREGAGWVQGGCRRGAGGVQGGCRRGAGKTSAPSQVNT